MIVFEKARRSRDLSRQKYRCSICYFLSVVCLYVSVLHRFRDITTFIAYETAYDRLATIDMDRKVGAAVPLSVGELAPHLTQYGLTEAYTSIPSDILIHPTVWPQYTNVTDRTDSHAGQTTVRWDRANPFTNGCPKNKNINWLTQEIRWDRKTVSWKGINLGLWVTPDWSDSYGFLTLPLQNQSINGSAEIAGLDIAGLKMTDWTVMDRIWPLQVEQRWPMYYIKEFVWFLTAIWNY